jgi:hypothetical protein
VKLLHVIQKVARRQSGGHAKVKGEAVRPAAVARDFPATRSGSNPMAAWTGWQ